MRYGTMLALWGGLWIGWMVNLHVVEANPPEHAVAQFIEHGMYDSDLLSAGQLFEVVSAAYLQETDPARREHLAQRLLTLKWWNLWEADAEMAPETTIVGDPLPPGFLPSENWQWSSPIPGSTEQNGTKKRLHFSVSVEQSARHHVKGSWPALLPANGILLQDVFFPGEVRPEQIWLRIETTDLGTPPIRPVFVQARWTKNPETPFATENRPSDFWAGTFEGAANPGKWHRLSVDLVDLGLCGRHRAILGIEFGVAGDGEVWFGDTIIRRLQVEIRGTQKYHVFSDTDDVAFEVSVHNFSSTPQDYELDMLVSDYHGSEVSRTVDTFHIAAKATAQKKLVIQPGQARYLLFDYSLHQPEKVLTHGYSAAAIINPNRTGRRKNSKFGMMYWNQPGKEMVELYEKLGVKLIVLFPQLARLHLFHTDTFDMMPMLWSLPAGKPKEAATLQNQLQPYLDDGQRIFSNFWETDLRVPAAIFAPQMQRFFEIVKTASPAALAGIGGMAWFNVSYLSQLLQAVNASKPFFDFITVMCYNTPSPPEYSGIDQENAALRTLLERAGQSQVEVWNVEWSYFENLNLDGGLWLNTGVAREQIAPYTIRHHLVGFEAGIERMVPGTNLYVGRTPLAKNYGHDMTQGRASVFRYDLTPLPLLPAYSTMTRMLEGKRFLTRLGGHPNVVCQVYTASENDPRNKHLRLADTVLVVWSKFGIEDVSISLPGREGHTGDPVTLISMLGQEITQHTYHGTLYLSVTPEPTYILLPESSEKTIHNANVTYDNPFLRVEPKTVPVSPGKAATVKLRVHLLNTADAVVRGSVTLNAPKWLKVLGSEIRYESTFDEEFARAMLTSHSTVGRSERDSEQIWLGRHRQATVTFDVMLPDTIPSRTYYEQTALTQRQTFPVFAEFLTAGQKKIARASASIQTRPPLSVRLRPILREKTDVTSPTIKVEITNNTSQPRQGDVVIKTPDGIRPEPRTTHFSLAPGEARTVMCTLNGEWSFLQSDQRETVNTMLQRTTEHLIPPQDGSFPLDLCRREFGYISSFGVGEGYVIEALVRDQTGYETRQSRGFAFRPAVRTRTPLRIDGQLDDWEAASPLFVHPEGRLSGITFFAQDYGREMQWTGLDDFSSAWQMMWDENFLYFATKVFDDHWVPQHELGSFWNGDTISLQIDPLPDLTDASIQPVPRNLRAVHTFDMGLSRQGPKIRRKYPSANRPGGVLPTAKCAMKQVDDGVQYEVAIPWDELTPLRPERGDWMGVSLVWYEDDGNGREASTNWFGGVGGNGLAREPRLMGDVHFVE